MGVLLLLVFVCSILTKIQSDERTLDPIIDFDFLQSQCSSNSFTDSAKHIVGSLIKETSGTECLNSNGLKSGTSVHSEKNISSLQTILDKNSYTIEMWIQPQLSASFAPFLTVGSDEKVVTSDHCQSNFKVSQRSFNLSSNEVSVGYLVSICTGAKSTDTGDFLKSAWHKIPVYNGAPSITHVVTGISYYFTYDSVNDVTTNYLKATYTTNGQTSSSKSYPIGGTQFGVTPMQWESSYNLMLLDSFSGGDQWGGNVHYLAIYNRTLSSSEIQQNYQAGLPNSPISATSETVTVQQNGEVGDHSNDPTYYLQSIPNNELAVITLPVYDLDDQRISPNYNPAVGATAQVYLTSLPAKGQLYYMDGTEITDMTTSTGAVSILVPYDPTTFSFAVRYRPPLNQYSSSDEVFATLSLYGVDGITGQQSNSATVSIVVKHVNQPPVATPTTATIYAAKTYIFTLPGSDADGIADIVAGVVTALPTKGSLYQVLADGVTANKQASISAGMAVTNTVRKVAYIYTGAQALVSGNTLPFVGSDEFSFALKDSGGRVSVPAKYKLTVNSALVAIPLAASAVVQAVASSVPLSVNDNADVKRNLRVKIVKLPLHGDLLLNGQPMRVGDLVMSGGGSSSDYYTPTLYNTASITYRSHADYFNLPRTSLNGTVISSGPDVFDFSLCAESTLTSTTCTAESPTVTQQVDVKNVNRMTEIFFDTPASGSSDMLTVKAVKGGKGETNDGTLATLSGFRLVDNDKGIDKVRVTISTTAGGGFVTLNSAALSQVDLLCATQPTWQCEGTGADDSAVTFVGSVSAVQRALNGMTYYSERENVKDTISITVYDGVGGDCLDEASQSSSTSYRDTCFVNAMSVSIQVMEYNKGAANGLQMSKTMQYIALAVIIIITLGCTCYGWRWCSNRYAEKAEIEIKSGKREQRERRRERRERKKRSVGRSTHSPRRSKHRSGRHQSPDNARSAPRHSRGDVTPPDYSDEEEDNSYDNYDYDDLESGGGGGAYCGTFQDAEEIQEMEETLFRLQKQTKSEKNALRKQHLMAQVKAQREKLEVVTEEIVQLEEEEQELQQRPVYSTPPRTTSPQRLPRNNTLGSASRSAGRGGGFSSQEEYDRHMAVAAAHQMRGASPAGNYYGSGINAPSSPHQPQRASPQRSYTRSPQTTRGRAPSSEQQYMAGHSSGAHSSRSNGRTPPRSYTGGRDEEPECYF